jgi:hypothetical protein
MARRKTSRRPRRRNPRTLSASNLVSSGRASEFVQSGSLLSQVEAPGFQTFDTGQRYVPEFEAQLDTSGGGKSIEEPSWEPSSPQVEIAPIVPSTRFRGGGSGSVNQVGGSKFTRRGKSMRQLIDPQLWRLADGGSVPAMHELHRRGPGHYLPARPNPSEKCPFCKGSGYAGPLGDTCERCEGSGWLSVETCDVCRKKVRGGTIETSQGDWVCGSCYDQEQGISRDRFGYRVRRNPSKKKQLRAARMAALRKKGGNTGDWKQQLGQKKHRGWAGTPMGTPHPTPAWRKAIIKFTSPSGPVIYDIWTEDGKTSTDRTQATVRPLHISNIRADLLATSLYGAVQGYEVEVEEIGVAEANPSKVAKKIKNASPGEWEVFHADHGISAKQMEYIKKFLLKQAPQGFFIKQYKLPKSLGTVTNAMYGPAAGDRPVSESKVHYMDRAGRGWEDRMVDLPPRPVNYGQVIGVRDGDSFTLYTVYGGPLSPQNPADPGNQDVAGSKKFWKQHALSSHQWAAAKPNPRRRKMTANPRRTRHNPHFYDEKWPFVATAPNRWYGYTTDESRDGLGTIFAPFHKWVPGVGSFWLQGDWGAQEGGVLWGLRSRFEAFQPPKEASTFIPLGPKGGMPSHSVAKKWADRVIQEWEQEMPPPKKGAQDVWDILRTRHGFTRKKMTRHNPGTTWSATLHKKGRAGKVSQWLVSGDPKGDGELRYITAAKTAKAAIGQVEEELRIEDMWESRRFHPRSNPGTTWSATLHKKGRAGKMPEWLVSPDDVFVDGPVGMTLATTIIAAETAMAAIFQAEERQVEAARAFLRGRWQVNPSEYGSLKRSRAAQKGTPLSSGTLAKIQKKVLDMSSTATSVASLESRATKWALKTFPGVRKNTIIAAVADAVAGLWRMNPSEGEYGSLKRSRAARKSTPLSQTTLAKIQKKALALSSTRSMDDLYRDVYKWAQKEFPGVRKKTLEAATVDAIEGLWRMNPRKRGRAHKNPTDAAIKAAKRRGAHSLGTFQHQGKKYFVFADYKGRGYFVVPEGSPLYALIPGTAPGLGRSYGSEEAATKGRKYAKAKLLAGAYETYGVFPDGKATQVRTSLLPRARNNTTNSPGARGPTFLQAEDNHEWAEWALSRQGIQHRGMGNTPSGWPVGARMNGKGMSPAVAGFMKHGAQQERVLTREEEKEEEKQETARRRRIAAERKARGAPRKKSRLPHKAKRQEDQKDAEFLALVRGNRRGAYREAQLLSRGSGSRGGYSAEERADLLDLDFLKPEMRSWPVADPAHAKIALEYMSRGFGNVSEYPMLIMRLAQIWPPTPKNKKIWGYYAKNRTKIGRKCGCKMPSLKELKRQSSRTRRS